MSNQEINLVLCQIKSAPSRLEACRPWEFLWDKNVLNWNSGSYSWPSGCPPNLPASAPAVSPFLIHQQHTTTLPAHFHHISQLFPLLIPTKLVLDKELSGRFFCSLFSPPIPHPRLSHRDSSVLSSQIRQPGPQVSNSSLPHPKLPFATQPDQPDQRPQHPTLCASTATFRFCASLPASRQHETTL